jgi:hypothetical protein
MSPMQNQIHVDTLLSNLSVKYRNADYIAMDVFPEMPVKKSSDLFRVYERNFRLPETNRANRGVAREHDFNVSTATYNLERHGLKMYISDSDADNYDLADLRAEATEELTDVILRRLEKSVADLFTTTNWSLNVSLAAGAEFTANTTTSNPIPVFDTGATTVIQNSGKKPNFGILPRDAFVACKNHVSVLDRTKYTSADMTDKMLAALFDLEKLLVPLSVIDTAAEGQAASISPLYNDIAFLGFKEGSPGPLKASAGYIFRKAVPLVKRWREEERASDAVEVNMEYQARIVASLSGYLIRNTV